MPEPDIKIDTRALDDGAKFAIGEGGWWDRREAVMSLCFFEVSLILLERVEVYTAD